MAQINSNDQIPLVCQMSIDHSNTTMSNQVMSQETFIHYQWFQTCLMCSVTQWMFSFRHRTSRLVVRSLSWFLLSLSLILFSQTVFLHLVHYLFKPRSPNQYRKHNRQVGFSTGVLCLCSSYSFSLDGMFQGSRSSTDILTTTQSTLSIEDKTKSVSSIAEQSSTPIRNPLEVVTSVINNLMTSSEPPRSKRKRMIERPFGESLTSMDAILKINQKENQTRKRKENANSTKRNASNGWGRLLDSSETV